MNRKSTNDRTDYIEFSPFLSAVQPSQDKRIPEITKPYSILMNASTKAQQLVTQAYICLLSTQAVPADKEQSDEALQKCLAALYEASDLIVKAQLQAENIILKG